MIKKVSVSLPLNKKFLDEILNLKLSSSSTSLNLFRFGIFLSKNLNIHLSFSSESFLLEIRKFLFFYQDIWENIDATVKENMWVAKSIIFNRNLLIENNSFIEVLKFLENWKLSSKKN